MGLYAPCKKWRCSYLRSQYELTIYAPISGRILPLTRVPDRVFAEKVVGDGIAIQPTGPLLVAPATGTLVRIFPTHHAFSLVTPQGVELFVHCGIDTVELQGRGFHRIAVEGETVTVGTPVITCDLAYLTAHARSLLTPVVICNMDAVKKLRYLYGEGLYGETAILRMTL